MKNTREKTKKVMNPKISLLELLKLLKRYGVEYVFWTLVYCFSGHTRYSYFQMERIKWEKTNNKKACYWPHKLKDNV